MLFVLLLPAPTVDVTNNTTQFVVNRDILDSIPTPIRNTARSGSTATGSRDSPTCSTC